MGRLFSQSMTRRFPASTLTLQYVEQLTIGHTTIGLESRKKCRLTDRISEHISTVLDSARDWTVDWWHGPDRVVSRLISLLVLTIIVGLLVFLSLWRHVASFCCRSELKRSASFVYSRRVEGACTQPRQKIQRPQASHSARLLRSPWYKLKRLVVGGGLWFGPLWPLPSNHSWHVLQHMKCKMSSSKFSADHLGRFCSGFIFRTFWTLALAGGWLLYGFGYPTPLFLALAHKAFLSTTQLSQHLALLWNWQLLSCCIAHQSLAAWGKMHVRFRCYIVITSFPDYCMLLGKTFSRHVFFPLVLVGWQSIACRTQFLWCHSESCQQSKSQSQSHLHALSSNLLWFCMFLCFEVLIATAYFAI